MGGQKKKKNKSLVLVQFESFQSYNLDTMFSVFYPHVILQSDLKSLVNLCTCAVLH